MFSTIKSRVVTIYALVLIISIICSLIVGAVLTKHYFNNQIFSNSAVLYQVDTGAELDSIANTEYFNKERIMIGDAEVKSNANRALILSIIIAAAFLTIIFSLLFNLGYNRFIQGALDINNEDISDFTNVKQFVDTQNDKLINSYLDIEKINAYINHELKNSLAVLKTKQIGSIELESYIEELNKQIDDINALTTNKLPVRLEIDLLLVIAKLIDNYPQHSIAFDFSDGDFMMLGNASLLSRALDNIIINAFKYGAKHLDIAVTNLHDSIVIKIANDGQPIEREQIDKIFDFKYRTPELKSDGSGIGLALVKNIVELHDGGIYVESDQSQTSFYLSFLKS
ncbi:HAMP domain-containing sensor histidine kinase [Mollicutes bacterium LVI A0039]|nr:HAMP domain-containing sensor histidine kinase [Mollicutes bacterium LVI A0039]